MNKQHNLFTWMAAKVFPFLGGIMFAIGLPIPRPTVIFGSTMAGIFGPIIAGIIFLGISFYYNFGPGRRVD